MANKNARRADFGRFLAERRDAMGMTQDEAAAKIGRSRVQLARWEAGVSMPGPEILAAIAAAYNIRVREVARRSGYPLIEDAPLDWEQRIAHKLSRVPTDKQATVEAALDSLISLAS